ncbi:cation acetate symporter [Blastopirellula sp. JC732]|uniref:Cation acetate symporter n=1 Tax=Blastopirellula sediminis TaxID=2894196 RepID=A0A9X1MNP6_9BACT|nr:sodium:solute symporter family protein [Blastopirellula sediminis]MCC9606053.1 cation acetate symporter [Blastopirellula sediminis]MCC9630648.1 cation acetate symporter [Blastopirellula sediminis]
MFEITPLLGFFEMSSTVWTYIFVTITFFIYIYIGWQSRVKETSEFYVAGGGVPAVANGAATAADWMSAASFLSMTGLIAASGYDGTVYLLGWTGGYVLLALLLAPYLRKFGQFTVPDFVGKRYYSETARIVAALCAVFVSITYVAGQMRGVGLVFSHFLKVPVEYGVVIGMVIVAFFAVLGGMKGITWTQVVQFFVLILAFLIPSIALSKMLTDSYIPQLGFVTGDIHDRVDALHAELGFKAYTEPFTNRSQLNVFLTMFALMAGTAGLPHVIVRFYTVANVRAARYSAGWALLFIALLYTAAPTMALFARYNLLSTLNGAKVVNIDEAENDDGEKTGQKIYHLASVGEDGTEKPIHWINTWQVTHLIEFDDKDGDGVISLKKDGDKYAEATIDKDILVLATPEVAGLPAWIVAIVATGGLAAALSTAAGLLLVISSSIAHDLYIHFVDPHASEAKRLTVARIMILLAIVVAGYFGIIKPGFIGEVVAFAFGLAAASFFPIVFLGIFDRRTNREGAICGMVVGILFTGGYILACKANVILPFLFSEPLITPMFAGWTEGGISPESIGAVGCALNFIVTLVVSRLTPAPPEEIQQLVDEVRIPRGSHAPEAHFDESDAEADNP